MEQPDKKAGGKERDLSHTGRGISVHEVASVCLYLHRKNETLALASAPSLHIYTSVYIGCTYIYHHCE